MEVISGWAAVPEGPQDLGTNPVPSCGSPKCYFLQAGRQRHAASKKADLSQLAGPPGLRKTLRTSYVRQCCWSRPSGPSHRWLSGWGPPRHRV